jgi:hypothetical protein
MTNDTPAHALPPGYRVRSMVENDYAQIEAICAAVYATERPYTDEELATHHRLFPEGQFVAEHEDSGDVAGVHFSLMLDLSHFHADDSWDVLTASGLFTDHDPEGHTLYGAELMVAPRHQHHGERRLGGDHPVDQSGESAAAPVRSVEVATAGVSAQGCRDAQSQRKTPFFHA